MPYWRLSSFYLFYFAALGALVPYLGLYLKSLGFDAIAIGSLMAILLGTKIIAPNIWGWIGDHLGHRMRIVQLASFIAILAFTGMFWVQGFWGIALVMVLYSFFWNASLPQFETVTFTFLGKHVSRYAKIRLWGSVGFIAMVAVLGVVVDKYGPTVVLPAVFLSFVGVLLASFMVKDPSPKPHPVDQGSILNVIRRPAILAFLVAVFLMQMSHGPYYAFYSIFMDEHGYSNTDIGLLWALGVCAEVLFFLFSHRIIMRWGGRIVLVVSLLLASLRWLLLGQFVDVLGMMLLLQLLHAATFGSFHAAAIHLVHHYFHGKHQGRGQALYASMSFGAGGAAGSLLSGLTWDTLGATQTYAIAAVIALLGAFIVWRFIDKEHDY